LASAAARSFGVVAEGRPVAVVAAVAARDAEVTVPQPAASAAISTTRKKNGFGFLTLTTLGRRPRRAGSAR
jgi:hypothetical protein